MMRILNNIKFELPILLFLLLINSCDNVRRREALTSQINVLYKNNYSDFIFIKQYFEETKDSIISIELVKKDSSIKLRKKDTTTDTIINWPTVFNNVNEVFVNDFVKPNSNLPFVIEKMNKIGLRSASGNEKWIYLTFNQFKIPCYCLWYKSDLDTSNNEIRTKILNYRDSKKSNWIYLVDEKWFIEGKKCF